MIETNKIEAVNKRKLLWRKEIEQSDGSGTLGGTLTCTRNSAEIY